ncbi:glycoside hydrolase family 78 protein [Zasmidium cellare ATCC 36951]|uniref:Glycoside hydrolase family 78 protein n=1 Tax=Zasmidium cellare ATCC 36951 TaxID=1080233 RepID=A0A6A6CH92_ZASCE|nr:glycoside hydrolase family 78 protein [Zasmidium cellare ATCC 36951]KAF2166607.1 glycoside hydrolase family 78 protein [Zasmidium cellare ATCC 36951]
MNSSQQKVIAQLNSNWIWVPDWVDSCTENTAGRIVAFIRHIQLPSIPKTGVLHISADTRYKLFINNQRVSIGPSRGSPYLWYYDRLDIAGHLREGRNEIRVEVLRYFAANRAAMPFGRTNFPGLTIYGAIDAGGQELKITSGDVREWRAQVHDEIAFPTGIIDDGFLHIYERVSVQPSKGAVTPVAYSFKTLNGDLLPWRLQPRVIPMPEESPATFGSIRRCESHQPIDGWLQHFLNGNALQLDAGSTHSIDLQADVHSTAFVRWQFRSTAESSLHIKIIYSEGFELEPRSYPFFRSKGDRLQSENGHILGPFDEVDLIVKPGQDVNYQPFWFRTFRIIRIEIAVGPAPVELVSFTATQTNYSLQVKATWEQPHAPETSQMWDVSIRTLQNCMFDGYSDCPFYEQLQYSMDSRAVGLFHYLLSGDDRLMRQAITHFASSTTVEGLPQSRFPSHVNQLIAAFPLYWILEICDHHLYFGDIAFTRSMMPRIDGVLEFFRRYTDERGLVSGLPDDLWQFVDWVTTWHATDEHPDKGVPTSGRKTNCHTYFSMVLAYVLREAASLAVQIGRPGFAEEYNGRAQSLCKAVRKHCYDGSYFTDSTADVADDLSYSQHCQVWAILSGAASREDYSRLTKDAFSGNSPINFSKCSYMMRFYALRAFAMAGDHVYEQQWKTTWDPWKKMLQNNLTTWEEDDVRQRSDCHAWGSLPIYEFCTELAGVKVLAPGATKILFKPRLRLAPEIRARICLGKDNLATVQWKQSPDGQSMEVGLKLQKAIEIDSQLPGGGIVEYGTTDNLSLWWKIDKPVEQS